MEAQVAVALVDACGMEREGPGLQYSIINPA